MREQSIFGWFSFSLGVNRKPQILVQPSKGSSLEWKKSFWTYKRSRSLSKSLSWGCLLCLLFRKSVDVVPWRWHIGVFWQNLVQKKINSIPRYLQICCQYGPTFTKGGHKERAVYHLRERRFISTWCKHPIHLTFDNGRERQKIINRSLLHLLGSLPSFYS